jgi:hypothetical protein
LEQGIADGQEPLTYSFRKNDREYQVEVEAKRTGAEELEMVLTIDIASNPRKWTVMKTSPAMIMKLTKSNDWTIESSS